MIAPPPTRWLGLEEQRPGLMAFLSRRCRCGHEVEDIVQETLLRAARFRRADDDPDRLRPWLQTIARNVFHDHLRRESRYERGSDHEGVELTLERLPGRADAADDDAPIFVFEGRPIDADSLVMHLAPAIASLAAADRRLIRTYYGRDGSGCTSTARALGLSADIVKVRLYRARKRLRRALRRELALWNVA